MPAALPHSSCAFHTCYCTWLLRVMPSAVKSLVCFGVSEALSQEEALSPSAGLPGDGQDALLISSHSGLSPTKRTTAACLTVLSR